MNKLGIVKFSGKSGHQYAFTAYPHQTDFEKGLGGVYVVTRRKPSKSRSGFVHRKICMGQSDDLCRSWSGDGRAGAERGANCICVHAEKDKEARLNVMEDLMQKPHPAADA
jgi:hypothetical protein